MNIKLRAFILSGLLLLTLLSFAQNNQYFGSVLIPKNEYFVKSVNVNVFWSSTNNSIICSKSKHKVMFIPAGNGFYFVKFQNNGYYLTVENSDLNKGRSLKIAKPNTSNSQKFKIISVGNGRFKFISFNGLAIKCDSNKLIIYDSLNKNNQVFEILESKSKIFNIGMCLLYL